VVNRLRLFNSLSIFASFLVLEAIILFIYDINLISRDALSWDTALYVQGWYLIAHHSITAYSTILGADFWGNHAESIMWLLAPFGLITHNVIVLFGINIVCLIGCQLVCFSQIEKIASQSYNKTLCVVAGVVLLLLNPWAYYAIASDFHLEIIMTLFLLLFVTALYNDRNLVAYLSFIGLILCGEVAILWALAASLGFLFNSAKRLVAAIYTGISIVGLVAIDLLGGDKSNTVLNGYAYLLPKGFHNYGILSVAAGAFIHPLSLIKVIISHKLGLWANLAPLGLIGLLEPATLPFICIVMLSNLGNVYREGVFSQPGFQSLPVYFLLTISLVRILQKIKPKKALIAVLLIILNVGFWFIIYVPKIPERYLTVGLAEAEVLNQVLADIPKSSEVVAWQGVSGIFSERPYIYALRRPKLIPVNTDPLYVIAAPYAGIETLSVSISARLIYELYEMTGSSLIADSANIFVFKITPQLGQKYLDLSLDEEKQAAFSLKTNGGKFEPGKNPAISFHNLGRGYLIYGDYFYAQSRLVKVTVNLKTDTTLQLQIWDDYTNKEVGIDYVTPNEKVQTATLYGQFSQFSIKNADMGFGIWQSYWAPPPNGELLELRIYGENIDQASIYWITEQGLSY
jgi:hypothetical protein